MLVQILSVFYNIDVILTDVCLHPPFKRLLLSVRVIAGALFLLKNVILNEGQLISFFYEANAHLTLVLYELSRCLYFTINPFKPPNGFLHPYYSEESILHFRGVRLIFSSLA